MTQASTRTAAFARSGTEIEISKVQGIRGDLPMFETRFFTGVGTVDDPMPLLLDIEKLMTGADMAPVDSNVH